jgi:hypothetical protein
MRTTPTSATHSDEVLNQEHLDIIKKSWKDSTEEGNKALGKPPKTPDPLRKMHQLLNTNEKPLYSVQVF